jgi:hypothetical protein
VRWSTAMAGSGRVYYQVRLLACGQAIKMQGGRSGGLELLEDVDIITGFLNGQCFLMIA